MYWNDATCTKFGKDHACGSGDRLILTNSQTHSHTHTHTDILITIFAHNLRGRSENAAWNYNNLKVRSHLMRCAAASCVVLPQPRDAATHHTMIPHRISVRENVCSNWKKRLKIRNVRKRKENVKYVLSNNAPHCNAPHPVQTNPKKQEQVIITSYKLCELSTSTQIAIQPVCLTYSNIHQSQQASV